MSDTPKNADAAKKLLDNGWTVVLFRNSMGSYTAAAFSEGDEYAIANAVDKLPNDCSQLTDDFIRRKGIVWALMARGVRKRHRCRTCSQVIYSGEVAYRPLTNSAMRGERICADCGLRLGISNA